MQFHTFVTIKECELREPLQTRSLSTVIASCVHENGYR